MTGRGVQLDAGRGVGTAGELPDGLTITTDHLEATILDQAEPGRDGGDLGVI